MAETGAQSGGAFDLRPKADLQASDGDASLDLTSCDREPIHIPGSIQPHGFLLAFDLATLLVREASANSATYLDRLMPAIFGRTPVELFGPLHGARLFDELTSAVRGGMQASTPQMLSSLSLRSSDGSSRHFEVIAHCVGERLIVEFEHSRERVDMEALNSQLYNFVNANRGHRSAEDVIQAAVKELRALTRCDRVVLYQFDEEGHGLVLAEDRSLQFASYLGLRFPASDIPKQARRMYELNRVRIIPDVDYEPSPLLAADGGDSPKPPLELDLSSSLLRSVSPVHRAYMRNMGTVCSMSVSILVDGKLWGLVSCHHHEPRYVPLRLRSACDFVMQVVGSQIESQQSSQHLARLVHSRAVQGRLLSAMAGCENYIDGLLANSALLMELVGADGVAIVAGGSVHLFGTTPSEEQVAGLAEWLGTAAADELLVTDQLSREYAAAAACTATGSGLIAAPLSRMAGTQVLWFRREMVATVRWAGDPHKPALPREIAPLAPGVTVSPRHSFDEWSQIVRGRSAAWTSEEVRAATEFRSSVLEIVLKRAEELAELAAGLRVANEELEAFSYSVSHDLRAPFRHISGFSEMLCEEEADNLSTQGKHYLKTIMNSARFAGVMVDSLLDFSRMARTQIERVPVAMEKLVDEEWEGMLHDEGRGRQIDFARGPLPRVSGDPHLLRLVVRNLLSNAVKYSGKREHAVIRFHATTEGQEIIFAIKDNGVGFDPQYAAKLFGVFQRLHRVDEFEGTGIGLANVRRIVGRHGGRTWAEAVLGEGATFFFSMPAVPSQRRD